MHYLHDLIETFDPGMKLVFPEIVLAYYLRMWEAKFLAVIDSSAEARIIDILHAVGKEYNCIVYELLK